MSSFKGLEVWREAHDLALEVYRVTTAFPKEELHGLTSQLRRAATSVPANIAEGCGRGGEAEFGRFLQISMGSASELEYHLLLATDLKLVGPEQYQGLEVRLLRMKRRLNALLQKVRAEVPQKRTRAALSEVKSHN